MLVPAGLREDVVSDLLLLSDPQIVTVGQSITFHLYLSQRCSSWLQNSNPPPCNLKAGLVYGTLEK